MSNKPSYLAYAVKDRGRKQKSIWTRIGAAWPHEKGAGLTLQLDTLPLDGRVMLMEPKADAKPEDGPAEAETFEGEAKEGV